MERIKAFCVKYGALILIFFMCLMLRGCIEIYRGTSHSAPEPTAQPAAAVEDSFTVGVPGTIRSDDGKLYAEQSLEMDEAYGVNRVRVTVYSAENGLPLSDFITCRAMDYWGICFEPGTWNIWVQSGDVGVYCMRYADGAWEKDTEAPLPDGVIARHGGAEGN